MARVRVQLHTPSGWQRLSAGSYVIGRSDVCEVVLDSSRASRKHARLDVSEHEATIADLGSANGTYVNGSKLTAPHSLKHGDFIVIGDFGLELAVELVPDEQESSPHPSPVASPAEAGPYLPPTSRVSAGEVLAAVADRAIASGNPEQAERTLERWLSRMQEDVRSAKKPDAREVMVAVRQALRLARSLGKRDWVDYSLELLGTSAYVPDRTTLDELTLAISNAGASPASLEIFEERIRNLPDGPEQRETAARAASWLAARS